MHHMHKCNCGDPESTAPEWLFRDLSDIHHAAFAAAFESYGIGRMMHPLILAVLEEYGDGGAIATQKELAEHMRLSPTTITFALKDLAAQGFVRKIVDDSDMRRNRVEITDAGRDVSKKCRAAIDEIDRVMYSGFSGEERNAISGFYVRMIKNLKSLGTFSEPGACQRKGENI